VTQTEHDKFTIVRTTRAIFPGRCILMGFNASGDFVVGLGCHPKSVYRWARSEQPRADKRQLQVAADELYAAAREGGEA
jgi:hypothetical protein